MSLPLGFIIGLLAVIALVWAIAVEVIGRRRARRTTRWTRERGQ